MALPDAIHLPGSTIRRPEFPVWVYMQGRDEADLVWLHGISKSRSLGNDERRPTPVARRYEVCVFSTLLGIYSDLST